jgi:phage minor structural protein
VISIITIYNSTETIFTHNGEGVLDTIIKSCKVTHELNGSYILDIEVVKDKYEKYKNIKEFCVIKVQGQLFRLYNLSNLQDNGITIRAVLHHISLDIDTDFLEDNRAENTTVDNALKKVILDNRFTILDTDMTNTNTAYFVKDKPMNAIFKTILPRWGGELKRDNFNIGIVSKIGKETGLSIEYGKNITGFEQTLDYSEIVTRMMPTGKDGCTIDLINGGSKWITSPRVNNYFKTFSSEVQFSDIEDATELKTTAEKLWGKIDLPKVNYKVSFVNLERTEQYKDNPVYSQMKGLELGDGVIIKHKIFNVNLTTRVIKIVKDGLTGKTLEIELGEFRDNLFNTFNNIDYKIASVSANLEETKKNIYTKVQQTDDMISLQSVKIEEVDGKVEEAKAELLIQADAITESVTAINSLDNRLDSAEQKITPTAIISTVRSSQDYIDDLGEKVNGTEISSIISQSANEVQTAFNGATGTFIIKNGKLILKNSANTDVMWCDTNGWLNTANLYIYGTESPANLEIGGSQGSKGIGIRTPNASGATYLDFAGLSKESTFAEQIASNRFHRIISQEGSRDTLNISVAKKLDISRNTGGAVEMQVQGTIDASGAISTTQYIEAAGSITGAGHYFNDGRWAIASSNIGAITYGVNGGNSYIEIATPSNGTWGADLWASDINLKENIVDAECNCLDKVLSIKHRTFDWKTGGHVNLGYVAQELREIDESFAFGVKQSDGSYIYQPAVPMIIPSITKAMQEQHKIIETLEVRLKALEDRLASA